MSRKLLYICGTGFAGYGAFCGINDWNDWRNTRPLESHVNKFENVGMFATHTSLGAASCLLKGITVIPIALVGFCYVGPSKTFETVQSMFKHTSLPK